jgi:hypothetical protein
MHLEGTACVWIGFNLRILGYGFHFQHRNPRTFPIESLVHNSGRTSVRAEYGYRKGFPHTNSYRWNSPLQLSIQCSPQRTSKRPSNKPHGATRQQAIAKTPAKLSAYQIPRVIIVFVVLVFEVLMLGGIPVPTAWRVLGLRMEERPPDMEVSCEYIE